MRLPRLRLQAMLLISKRVISLIALFENRRHKRRAAPHRVRMSVLTTLAHIHNSVIIILLYLTTKESIGWKLGN
jgi:hypothetical protein